MGRMSAFAWVTADSRAVTPGSAFVAVPGVKVDGCDFAAEAVARGAKAVFAERDIPGLGVPVTVVPDARAFLGEAVADWYGNPSRELRVWGVTGTNGKTTTTWLLAAFLRAATKRTTGLVTTVETVTGLRTFASEHTTPDAAALQGLFREMRDRDLSDCVMEVSSHAVVQKRIAGTVFAGGAFTNLTEDHLDFHKTMEAYFEAKLGFFRQMAATSPGAPVAVCTDGEPGRRMADAARALGLKVVTCALEAPADFRADRLVVTPRGTSFDLTVDGKTYACAASLTGRYNVENALVALALARAAGVPLDASLAVLPTLEPRWGRLERVSTRSAATVFVDFAHTDDALANVLSTVKAFTKGRVWAVFGAGGDRDRRKRPLMGAAAARWADELVVTSDNPRSESPEAIIGEIRAGIPASASVKIEPDRECAIYWALSHAKEGDSVVVCGKGHETTQTIGSDVIPFDDREVCRAF